MCSNATELSKLKDYGLMDILCTHATHPEQISHINFDILV